MDVDNAIALDGTEAAHQNGLDVHLIVSEEDNFLPGDVNGNVGSATETGSELQNGTVEEGVSIGELEGSKDNAQSNELTVSKEGEVKREDKLKKSKPQKARVTNKNEKPLRSKNISSGLVKKTKDGKSVEATSNALNGPVASSSLHKQPQKTKSFNDRQAAKHDVKQDAALPGGIKEKTGLKPLRKAPLDKAEDVVQSPSTSEDGASRKAGALPKYDINFKCDERAEKRREFYSKLEEKNHAREQEKNNLLAKSKETQEAELKMLRKSLNFKATPMPNFYQEPPPPKVELKKIPTTRAKSPKLGRRKSSTPADNISNSSSGRLSLDEMTNQSNPIKEISPVHSKKPQRKSLPKLPTERTRLSIATKPEKTPSKAKIAVKTSSSKVSSDGKPKPGSTNEEKSGVTDEGATQDPVVSTAESNETDVNNVPDHHQLDSIQEPIDLQQ